LSPIDVIAPDLGQARIVSRIALSLASDAGSASGAAIEVDPAGNAGKHRASVSNSCVFVMPP
jgi:hypothetical protein